MPGSNPTRVVSDGLCPPQLGCVGEPRSSPRAVSRVEAPALRCHSKAWLWQACFSSMAGPPKVPRWGPAWLMAFLGTEPATNPQQRWTPQVPGGPPGLRGWGGSGGLDFRAVSTLVVRGSALGHWATGTFRPGASDVGVCA